MDLFIAPIEFSNSSLLRHILDQVREQLKVTISVIKLPIDILPALSKERGQFYSTHLIAEAIKITQPYQGKVLLLVDFDLYVPVFTYVFGEAQLSGKHSIVSLCRLHEEFYSGNSNEKLLVERACKEIIHELGHNFGLYHCKSWDCVMHTSQGVEEIDIKGGFYCAECFSQIEEFLK